MNTKHIEIMRTYLENLITEKGVDLDTEIELDYCIGFTYQMLIEFIMEMKHTHTKIRKTLVAIDFQNGDIFHYLHFLADGALKSMYNIK